MSDKEFQALLTLTNVNLFRQTEEKCRSIYEIVIKKQENDYFDQIERSSKFTQLESVYFRARNELLKDHEEEARKLFFMLRQEDSRLFVVKAAQEYLGKE